MGIQEIGQNRVLNERTGFKGWSWGSRLSWVIWWVYGIGKFCGDITCLVSSPPFCACFGMKFSVSTMVDKVDASVVATKFWIISLICRIERIDLVTILLLLVVLEMSEWRVQPLSERCKQSSVEEDKYIQR